MRGKLYQVKLPYACFGVILNKKNIVIKSAPIARWLVGKNIYELERYVERKKGTMRRIDK